MEKLEKTWSWGVSVSISYMVSQIKTVFISCIFSLVLLAMLCIYLGETPNRSMGN